MRNTGSGRVLVAVVDANKQNNVFWLTVGMGILRNYRVKMVDIGTTITVSVPVGRKVLQSSQVAVAYKNGVFF